MHVYCSKSKQHLTEKEIPNQTSAEISIDTANKFGTDSKPVAMSAFNALVECATNLRPRGTINADAYARINLFFVCY
jgi:hypothetical protein